MTIPRAIQEASDRADAIHAQLYGNTEQPPAPVEVQAEITQPEGEAPPPPTPVADASWEEKYRVLAGKYAAEVPRYAQEVRELKAQLQSVNERLSAQPEPVAENPDRLTPAQVVEQFGEEFAAAVGAIAAQVSDRQAGKLRDEFAPKVEAAQNAAALAARQEFMRDLTQAVPDWQVIDQDPRFTAFLDDVDALSGMPRRHFFNDADTRNDAGRIAHFFRSFRVATQAPAAQPAQQLPGKSAIEYALSPSSERSNDAPAGKKVWSRAEVAGFYQGAHKLLRSGQMTHEQYERIESDIYAAQRENRVIG